MPLHFKGLNQYLQVKVLNDVLLHGT